MKAAYLQFLSVNAQKSLISCGFQSNSKRFATNHLGIERQVTRLNGVQEAGGSIPLTQTKETRGTKHVSRVLLFSLTYNRVQNGNNMATTSKIKMAY